MSRKNLRRTGGEQLEEISAAQQSMENIDSVCSQQQISDVCEPTNISKGVNNENALSKQQDVDFSSSSNPSSHIPTTIPSNEADMICTTIENVSHVRFEWTVEDFYPQMYECGDMIQSEEFPPYDFQKEFWTLRLYPKGYQRSSTDDDPETPFYLTLCPSHISSSNSVTANAMQIHFRALINFSNPQGRVLHTETIQNCGGNTTDEIILMKLARSTCEELYQDSIDHLIISIELVSIDDIAKRSMKTSTTKMLEGSSRVVSKVVKMKLRWKIEKFPVLVNESANQSFIQSCEFTFNKQRTNQNVNTQDDEAEEQVLNGTKASTDIPPHQWSLILYPNGKTERFKGSLSIFLEHTFGPSVRVVIRFSLIDGRGRRINTKQLPSHVLAVGERWGVGDFIKHAMLVQNQQELIPGNELRIYCQIKILERQSIDEMKLIPRPVVALPRSKSTTAGIHDNPATYWPTLFYSAYLEKKMFDMYVRCGNEMHAAHKLVLSLRSNVLAKMIKEKERAPSSPAKPARQSKRSNATNETMDTDSAGSEDSSLLTIDITDIDQKAIPYFLEYLYTGGIKKLAIPGAVTPPTLVIDLLTIATNYEIADLRTYAEYYLKDVIRVDNACELLILSDNIKSETLKQTTCDFIANNLGHVMETTGWTELKAKQPDLIDIILKSCLLLRK